MKKVSRWMVGILVAVTLACTAQADVSASWNQDADGNWSDGGNWAGGNAAVGATGAATFDHAITAPRTVTIDTSPLTINALTFSNTGASGWTITGGTLLFDGATPIVTVSASSTAKIASIISGSSSLIKKGDGTLILTGANNYSGDTAVWLGTLQIGDGTSATASAGSGVLEAGGALSLNLNGAATLANSFVHVSGGIQNIGAGKVTITNDYVVNLVDGGVAGIVLAKLITYDFKPKGDVTFGSDSAAHTIWCNYPDTTLHFINNGTFWWIGGAWDGAAPNFDIAAGVTVSLSSGQGFGTIYYKDLTGLGNFIFDGGDANQRGFILGTSTLSGTLTANREISFGNGGAVGAAGATRIVSAANGPVTFNSTIDNTYSGVMSGAGALIKSSANKLTLAGTNTYSGATTINSGTLVIGGSGTLGAGVYAGNILNNGAFFYSSSAAQTLSGSISGTGGLTKSNTSTLMLAGYNTYTGDTRVDAGTLIGLTGGACLNSPVIVAGGTTNAVKVVAYGDQWTCAGLTYADGAAGLVFDMGVFPVSAVLAPLQINGDLNVAVAVELAVQNGTWPAIGRYPLVSYTGTLNNSGAFTLADLPQGMEAALVFNVEAKRIELEVTAIPTASGSESIWTHLVDGNAGGEWSTGSNWLDGNVPDAADAVANFSTLDLTTASAVHNDGPHTAGMLLFGDTTDSHGWAINGSTLTLATSLGVPTVTVLDGQADLYAGLAGSQGFIKDGPGTLKLAGLANNTFGGQVVVASGILYVEQGASLKNTSAAITVLPGAALTVLGNWDGNAIANPLYLSGSGYWVYGALHIWANQHVSGPITLVTDARITYENYCDVYGPITATGAGKSLELGQTNFNDPRYCLNIWGSVNLGTGSLIVGSILNGGTETKYSALLAAANSYSGGTVVTNHAILRVSNIGALGSGGLTLYPTATMDLYAQSMTLPWLSGTGGTITDAYEDVGTTTLTVNQSSDTVYTGVIKNGATRTLALVKAGTGSLSLSGASTYTGATTVENGTLCADGSLGTVSLTVNTGSAFGAGTLGGAGHVNLAGTLTFLDNSRLLVDVQRALADTISVAGDVAINSGVELQISGDQSYGGKWKVVESIAGTLSGDFTLIGGVNGSRLTKEGNALWLIIPPKGTLVLIR